MESHASNPKTETHADPWETVRAEFGHLGRRLKEVYRRIAAEDGPSEEEIKQALSTLAGAWDQIAESVTSALQEDEVRQQLKQAAGSFAMALGATLTELGNELNDAPNQPRSEEE